MPAIIEVTPHVWVTLSKTTATITAYDTPIEAHYGDISALSRALSIVKESPQYATWLRKAGLA